MRGAGHYAGQRQQLGLPAGKAVRVLVQPAVHAEEMRQFGYAAAHGLLRGTQVFQPEGQFVPGFRAHHLVFGILRYETHGAG